MSARLSRDEPVEFFGEVVWPLKQAGVQLDSVAEGGIQDWNNLPGVLLGAVYQDRSSGESKKTAWRVTGKYHEAPPRAASTWAIRPTGTSESGWTPPATSSMKEPTRPNTFAASTRRLG